MKIGLILSTTIYSKLLDIPDGSLNGKIENGVAKYFSIPFAQPPVGALRWEMPQKVDPWGAQLLDAQSPSHDECVQLNGSGSEDCLYLNVFAPENATDLPVMVWFHGGAHKIGSNLRSYYDGEAFAIEQNVITVFVNYRLNIFGSLFRQEANVLGNQFVYDNIMALEWVEKNIQYFGGNKDSITIFGESAGGQIVGNLLSLPEKYEHLFHKAIMQSNPLGIPYHTVESMTRITDQVLSFLNCPDFECAKTKSVEECLQAQRRAFDLAPVTSMMIEMWMPVIDGTLFKSNPLNILAENQHQKPMITGYTTNEGALFTEFLPGPTGLVVYNQLLNLIFKDDAAKVKSRFPYRRCLNLKNCDSRRVLDPIFNYVFICPGRKLLKDRKSLSDFFYYYNYPFPGPKNDDDYCSKTACHSVDVPMLFGAARNDFTLAEQELSSRMRSYWAEFARTGSPNAKFSEYGWWGNFDYDERFIFDSLEPKSGPFNVEKIESDCEWFEREIGYLRY